MNLYNLLQKGTLCIMVLRINNFRTIEDVAIKKH